MQNSKKESGAFDGLIEKIVFAAPKWVMPNHITMLRLVLVFVLVMLFLRGCFILAFITFLIASFSDAIDGALARQRNQITKFGSRLDPIVDKFLIISIIILLFRFIPWPILILIIATEIYMTVGAYIFHKKNLPIKANIFGKLKMNFEITAVLLLFFKLIFKIRSGLPEMFAILSFCIAIFLAILSFLKHIADSQIIYKS